MVRDVHARRFPVPAARLGELLDTLGGEDDRLWPAGWPPARFPGGLVPGSKGGHGPVRYVVEHAEPGRLRCRFTAPRGVDGHHEFAVLDHGDTAELRHVLIAR